MTLDKAINLIVIEYERAKHMDYVEKPLAFALYQVWKIVDSEKGDKK